MFFNSPLYYFIGLFLSEVGNWPKKSSALALEIVSPKCNASESWYTSPKFIKIFCRCDHNAFNVGQKFYRWVAFTWFLNRNCTISNLALNVMIWYKSETEKCQHNNSPWQKVHSRWSVLQEHISNHKIWLRSYRFVSFETKSYGYPWRHQWL